MISLQEKLDKIKSPKLQSQQHVCLFFRVSCTTKTNHRNFRPLWCFLPSKTRYATNMLISHQQLTLVPVWLFYPRHYGLTGW